MSKIEDEKMTWIKDQNGTMRCIERRPEIRRDNTTYISIWQKYDAEFIIAMSVTKSKTTFHIFQFSENVGYVFKNSIDAFTAMSLLISYQ